MANEQINIDILINASKSAKTLKEQRKALEDLKDGLDEVKYGSGAFELLNEEVTNLTSSMGNLNLKFEDVYGDIQPLTGRIGELEDRMYELALAGQQNTKEFIDLQNELVTMKRAVKDVDDQVDAFTQRGRGITQVVGAVQGLVATFNIAQGAIALFGDENEQLEKTLVRLNAGMAILQGLQEVSNQLTEKGTLLNKLFNIVLKANPIFIIVGVITAAVAAWALFNDKIGKSLGVLKKQGELLDKKIVTLDKEIAKNKKLGISIDDLSKKRVDAYNNSLKVAQAELKLVQNQLDETVKAYKLAEENITSSIPEAIYFSIFGASDEDVAEVTAKLEETKQKVLDIENLILDDKLDKKQADIDAEAAVIQRKIDLNQAYEKDTRKLEKDLLDVKMKGYDKDSIEYKDLVNQKKVIDAEYFTEYNNAQKEISQKRIDDLKNLEKAQRETFKIIEEDTEDLFGGNVVDYGENFNKVFQQIRDDLTGAFATTPLDEFQEKSKAFLLTDEFKKLTDAQKRQIIGLLNGYKQAKEGFEAFGLDAATKSEEFVKIMDKSAAKMQLSGEILYKELDGVISEVTPNFTQGINVLENYNKQVTHLVEMISKNKGISIEDAKAIFDEYQTAFEETYKLEDSITGFVFENIEKRKIQYQIYNEQRDNLDQEYELKLLERNKEQELSEAKTNEERLRINIEYNNAKLKLLNNQFQIESRLLDYQQFLETNNEELSEEERLLIVQKYKNLQLDLQIKFNKQSKELLDENEKDSKNMWTRLKDYIKDNPLELNEAIANQFASTLEMIDAFYTSFEERRISTLQQESDLRLEAIDAEKQAYLDSITQQTNAEKFKAAKLKEFDDKAAVEEKKRDKQIAEAQYKGEIRKWEYSYLEAMVNLGKSLLAAAANPFQLAVVGALGVTQLATIQANKPEPPQFGMGGMIEGPSHNGGGVDINAEGGEVIINKKSSAAFLPILDTINQAYGGTPLMNTNVMANGGIVGGNSSIDTSNLEKIVSQILNRPIKTYVVSSDMTSQQNSDMVLKNRTSF